MDGAGCQPHAAEMCIRDRFVAVGAVLGSWLLNMPFCFRPLWDGYGPWVPRGAEAVAAAVLLFLGLGLCVLACWRQRKRELLS